ncbi:hypothetical protein FRC09_012385, partial [Ceratobasidium sp. 395]
AATGTFPPTTPKAFSKTARATRVFLLASMETQHSSRDMVRRPRPTRSRRAASVRFSRRCRMARLRLAPVLPALLSPPKALVQLRRLFLSRREVRAPRTLPLPLRLASKCPAWSVSLLPLSALWPVVRLRS